MTPSLSSFIRSQDVLSRRMVDRAVQYADSLYEKASAIQDDNFRRAQHYRQQADTFLSSL